MAVTLGQYKAHFWTWTNSWEEFRQVQAPEYKPGRFLENCDLSTSKLPPGERYHGPIASLLRVALWALPILSYHVQVSRDKG